MTWKEPAKALSASPSSPVPQPDPSPDTDGLSPADEFFYWCFQHWLLIINGIVLIYGGLPWLSPLLISMGYTGPGNLLFLLYTPLCHQNPTNSPFLLGHQVAFCVRESSMFTALFVGGLIYAGMRHKLVKHPMSLKMAAVLLLPLIFDGIIQTIDTIMPELALRPGSDAPGSFNWWMRVISGILFATAAVLAVYPRLDRDLRGTGEEEVEV